MKQHEQIEITSINEYDRQCGLQIGDKGYIVKQYGGITYECVFPRLKRFRGWHPIKKDGKHWYVQIIE